MDKLSSISSIITESISRVGKDAAAFLLARGLSAEFVSNTIRSRPTEFKEALHKWAIFNKECSHDQTEETQMAFWVIVLPAEVALKMAATATGEDIPEGVHVHSVDYAEFMRLRTGVATRNIRRLVCRERSLARRCNIMYISIPVNAADPPTFWTSVAGCDCRQEFRLTHTLEDFKRYSNLQYHAEDEREQELRAAQLFSVYQHMKKNGATLPGSYTAALEREMLKMEGHSRMCRACKRVAIGLEKCGGCKRAWYCNRECQTIDWKAGHSKRCGHRQKAPRAIAKEGHKHE